MNNIAFNTNRLLVPTSKRNIRGNVINSVIPINDDCWRNICERLNWLEWAKLCLAYPQFSNFTDGKSLQTLVLEMGTILCKPLADNADLIRDVLIYDGPKEYNYIDILENYEILTAIEILIVMDAEHPLTYIKSENLKYLAISTVYQNTIKTTGSQEEPINTDFVEPILAISKNIEQLHIAGSHLNENSFQFMANNPIDTLLLSDVTIDSPNHLKNFLTKAIHLTHIELWGSGSTQLHKHFLDTDYEGKQPINTISIILLPEVNQEQYHNIRHFTNLEHIRIMYTDWEKLELFLGSLTLLRNIKTIELHGTISARSEFKLLSILEEHAQLLEDFEELIKHSNIILSKCLTSFWNPNIPQDDFIMDEDEIRLP